MDKAQALEKINKLLRLANDRGATDSEREVALSMAKKFAEKHGLRIEKGNPNQPKTPYNNQVTKTLKNYSFHLNCYNAKLVRHILYKLGIVRVGYDKYKKEVYFFTTKDFNVDLFKAYYKRLAKVFYDTKKDIAWSGREYFEFFSREFTKAYNGEYCHYWRIEQIANELKMIKNNIVE